MTNKYKNPGRGRKYCPGCESYIPAMVKKCDCDFEFQAGIKHEPAKPITDEDREIIKYLVGIGGKEKNDLIIFAAAGKCPIKLANNCSKGYIHQWCELMISEGRQRKKIYMPEALILFMISSDIENKTLVARHIKEWANEKRNACKNLKL